jgi:hypothetical protein
MAKHLDTEYRDLLHALIDDKPGAREALVDFHERRAHEADLERASVGPLEVATLGRAGTAR